MNSVSAYQDSPQKQCVRDECWIPQLAQRRNKKGTRIKYLTLPGKDLSEIRLLVQEKIVIGMSDLLLCEESKPEYYRICRDLPNLSYESEAEIPTIALGKIEEIILNGDIDRHFPVDAVNLDFVGGAWGNNRYDTSKKFEAIKCIIQKQGGTQTGFTLFVTVSSHGGGERFLDEVLCDYEQVLDDKWADISVLPTHAKVLIALPVIVTHYAIENNLDILCTHKYTYIGEGLSTRMLKFAFELDPFDNPSYTSSTQNKARKERQRVTEVLQKPTIELYIDSETGNLQQRTYNPSVKA